MFEDGIPAFIADMIDPTWRERARRRQNGDGAKDTREYWERRLAAYRDGPVVTEADLTGEEIP